MTTKDLINVAAGNVPPFDPGLLGAVNDELTRSIEYAKNGYSATPAKEWSVVFHISVPYGVGFAESAEAASGRFAFLKTRIVPQALTRLSGLVVRCTAQSAQAAQIKASREAMIVLALLTLSERRKYDLTSLQWPRSWRFRNVFPSSKAVPEHRPFPPRRYVDGLEATDPSVIVRFEELWSATSAWLTGTPCEALSNLSVRSHPGARSCQRTAAAVRRGAELHSSPCQARSEPSYPACPSAPWVRSRRQRTSRD